MQQLEKDVFSFHDEIWFLALRMTDSWLQFYLHHWPYVAEKIRVAANSDVFSRLDYKQGRDNVQSTSPVYILVPV